MTRFQRFLFNFFNYRGRTILRELIITLCAGDPQVLRRVRMQRVILRTEKHISELPWAYFILVKLCLYLLEYSIPPFSLKLRPFTALPLEKRLAYLEEWQTSRLYLKRILLKMLMAVCVTHIYSERRLLISIGYGPSMQHRTNHSKKPSDLANLPRKQGANPP